MPLPANTIADWFLAKADEVGDSLTPMKLLKLVYIAQGVSLGARNLPLFDETETGETGGDWGHP